MVDEGKVGAMSCSRTVVVMGIFVMVVFLVEGFLLDMVGSVAFETGRVVIVLGTGGKTGVVVTPMWKLLLQGPRWARNPKQ